LAYQPPASSTFLSEHIPVHKTLEFEKTRQIFLSLTDEAVIMHDEKRQAVTEQVSISFLHALESSRRWQCTPRGEAF
jgi:hypothetical protein